MGVRVFPDGRDEQSEQSDAVPKRLIRVAMDGSASLKQVSVVGELGRRVGGPGARLSHTIAGCAAYGAGGRAIAFEIYRPVTPAKAGVQRAQNEDNDLETADLGHWIPAFAGMTVAESAGLMS